MEDRVPGNPVFGFIEIICACIQVAFPTRKVAASNIKVHTMPRLEVIGNKKRPNGHSVHRRATAVAILTFCANQIGAGMGPLMLRFLSDQLAVAYGDESLRMAFFSLVPTYVCAALVFTRMARSIETHTEDARNDSLGHVK